jgi:hypothetical protein
MKTRKKPQRRLTRNASARKLILEAQSLAAAKKKVAVA